MHSAANPLSGVPTASPGKSFNFSWNAFQDLAEGEFQTLHVRVTVDDGGAADPVVFGPLQPVTTLLPELGSAVFKRQLARRAIIARTPLDFLGVGLLSPFRRGARDFVSGGGVELVRSSVRQILGTRAAVGKFAGELPWRPNFGSKLWVREVVIRGRPVPWVTVTGPSAPPL